MLHQAQLQSFLEKLNDVRLSDKNRLKKKLIAYSKESILREDALVTFDQQLNAAKSVYQQRLATLPFIDYSMDLPISHKKEQIKKAIKDHQVVIIAGETGSGKTTQIPKICLELGLGRKGMIAHTQPRRLAARTVAKRLSEELHTDLGGAVGYKVRFHEALSALTLVKIMTDGILLSEIQHDRALWQYDALIIDEAHERSLNIDFLLGYLKQMMPRRPDLKIIITSATIDHQRFSTYFNNAPIIEVSGRCYPVDIRYLPLHDNDRLDNGDLMCAITEAVELLYKKEKGDILVFLSGEREIQEVARALSKLALKHTEILPLYARLSIREQNRIFAPCRGNRIILATNVAETSLTVPGIKYVIDTGQARISRYSLKTQVQRLPIEPISQASANQRTGRCGRTSDGICIRLYAKEDYLTRALYTDPEISRTNLASTILQMLSLGLGEITEFPFIEMPDKRLMRNGVQLLQQIGAITIQQRGYQLTVIGKQLAKLPVDPKLGRMILEAACQGCLKEILVITAALSLENLFERPLDKQQAADEKHKQFANNHSDFLCLLNLWNFLLEQQSTLTTTQFRRLCQKNYLNYLRIREWQDLHAQLSQAAKALALSINTVSADYCAIHRAVLSGLLSHIGMKENEKHEFLGARNIKFSLMPGSVLFKKPPKWCVTAELVETTRLWGRIAAKIEPEWLEPLAKHLIKKSYSEPHWSKRLGSVVAYEKVTLFGLPIVAKRPVNYSSIDPTLTRELFIRHGLVGGDVTTNHLFYKKNLDLINSIEKLEHKFRRKDIMIDEETLYGFYDAKLPMEVVSLSHFDTWWKKAKLIKPDLLDFNKTFLINHKTAQSLDSLAYPDYWTQGNLTLPLVYHFDPRSDRDGVRVIIPISVLNQVNGAEFSWQIPGLRHEMLVALIRALPKTLRRHLVPAPHYATAFLERVQPLSRPLMEALESEFHRMTGVVFSREAWQFDQLPNHLTITFRIVDEKMLPLAQGKNLDQLKTQLKSNLQHDVSSIIGDNSIEKQGLTNWNFGRLPNVFQCRKGDYTVKVYPAIVDNKQSVSLRFFDSPKQQYTASLVGLRRLILLNIPSLNTYLKNTLPNKTRLALYFNRFGTLAELIEACVFTATDTLIDQNGGMVWDQQAFEQLLVLIKNKINSLTGEIVTQVDCILTLHFRINKKLKEHVSLSLAVPLSDIKNQLSKLIYKDFVVQTGYPKLLDVHRYLMAIEHRLDKLGPERNKDNSKHRQIDRVETAYRGLLSNLVKSPQQLDACKPIRWMIEEFRVSLFAQLLGTPYPISEKRIMQQIEKVKKEST